MYWDAKKQQGTDSSCVTIVPLQNTLIVHIFKVKHVVPAISRILFDCLLTLSQEMVFTKSTNNQSLEMTAPAPCKLLILCVELERILDPLLILFMGKSSTMSIELTPGPIAPILLELRFAN